METVHVGNTLYGFINLCASGYVQLVGRLCAFLCAYWNAPVIWVELCRVKTPPSRYQKNVSQVLPRACLQATAIYTPKKKYNFFLTVHDKLDFCIIRGFNFHAQVEETLLHLINVRKSSGLLHNKLQDFNDHVRFIAASERSTLSF